MMTFLTTHLATVLLTLAGVSVVLCATSVFLFVRTRQLATTLAYMMRGKKGASLEDVIMAHGTELDAAKRDISALRDDIAAVRSALRKSILHKSVVRYNPFKDLGGDQSFVVALLDSNHNGVVISSLHTREGTRVYAKPITQGTSAYKLSDEEARAVHDAITHTA